MGQEIDTKARFQYLVDTIRSKYSIEDTRKLISMLLGWGEVQTRYSVDSDIIEILSDVVLRYENAFFEVLNMDMKEIPLLINKEDFTTKVLAMWKLSCGI